MLSFSPVLSNDDNDNSSCFSQSAITAAESSRFGSTAFSEGSAIPKPALARGQTDKILGLSRTPPPKKKKLCSTTPPVAHRADSGRCVSRSQTVLLFPTVFLSSAARLRRPREARNANAIAASHGRVKTKTKQKVAVYCNYYTGTTHQAHTRYYIPVHRTKTKNGFGIPIRLE